MMYFTCATLLQGHKSYFTKEETGFQQLSYTVMIMQIQHGKPNTEIASNVL